MRYRFNQFTLDTDRFELSKNGTRLHVEPQVIELLVLLIENRDRMISREELNKNIWRGRFVSDTALSSRIKIARRILGDDGRRQQVIRTIHKKGFSFVAEVEVEKTLSEHGDTFESAIPEAQISQSKSIDDPIQMAIPAIAVLPFKNLSSEVEQDFFSDGLTNDIITDLSKFGRPTVIPARSTFAYKNVLTSTTEIAQVLGARYMLEGSVQKSGNRVRINAQLHDVKTGQQIWTERFNREVGDLFEIQDEIIATIVGTLSHRVDSIESARSVAGPNTDAYNCYLTGRELFFVRTRESNLESRRFVEKAIRLDPKLARAYGFLAWLHIHDYRYGWSDEPDLALDLSLELALKALALDASDYDSHWRLGFVHLHRRQFDKAMAEYEKARKLNSNHAGFLAEMSSALIFTGRFEEAINQLKRAMKINPQYPEWFLAVLGWAYYEAGLYGDAKQTLNKMNNPPGVYRPFIAATYIKLEMSDKAQAVVAELLKLEPQFNIKTLQRWPYQNNNQLQRFADDLRAAGISD